MNSLKEKSDSERASSPQRLTKVRACMCSTSRRLASGRLRSSFSPQAAKLACTFLFCVIWRIACVRSLVSLRRRSGLLKDINQKAESKKPEQKFWKCGVSEPRAVATGSYEPALTEIPASYSRVWMIRSLPLAVLTLKRSTEVSILTTIWREYFG